MEKSKPPKARSPKNPNSPRARKPAVSAESKGMNPQQASFDAFYINGGPDFRPGNAYQAAIAAGYSPATAKSNCHILARRASIRVLAALEARGCDGFDQANKLLALREARTVRWNPKKNRFDQFTDNSTQLEATKEINRILDAYPAPKEKVTDSRPITIVFPQDLGEMMPAKPKPGEK